MSSRLLAIRLSLLPLIASASVCAASEYWVAVGSYTEIENAEQAQQQATETLPDTFQIAPATTPSGYFYRVLAGPFITPDIATRMVEEARQRGFSGAWVLVTDALSAAAPAPLQEGVDAPTRLSPRAGDPEPMAVPQSDSDVERKRVPVVVTEAPAGYSLNRLKRGDRK